MSMQAVAEQSFSTSNPSAVASAARAPMKIVYVVVDRGPGKSFWTRVGAAFTNRDGSLTVRLDAVPMTGSLQIRDYVPREEGPSSPGAGAAPPPPSRTGSSLHADIPF